MQMQKKKYNLVIGLMLVLIALLAVVGIPSKSTGNQTGLITVNTTQIAEEEFTMFLQDQKAMTVNYFVQKYNAEYGAEFWTTEYEGEVPLEVAKQAALEEVIRIKIEQEIAQELGLIKDNQFETIMKLAKEDKSIYGVENLDFFQQYTVYHSKLMLEAQQKYKIKTKDISEKEIQAKYEAIKEEVFQVPDHIETIILEVELLDQANQETYLETITQDIMAGITVEDLQNKYKDQGEINARAKTYGPTEGKDENMSEIDLILKEAAYMLETGEMSMPIYEPGTSYIVICMNRENNGIAALEEVKVVVEDQIKEERFEAYIQAQIDKAKVQIDEVRLSELGMQ